MRGVSFTPAAAKKVQTVVTDYLRRGSVDGSIPNGGLVPSSSSWFLGQIATAGPSGEANYTDQRYWFKRALLSTSGPATDENTVAIPAPGDSLHLWATVENLAERAAGTHNLADGDLVVIFPAWDTNDATARRRYLTATGGAGGGSDLPTPYAEGQVVLANSSKVWIASFPKLHPDSP